MKNKHNHSSKTSLLTEKTLRLLAEEIKQEKDAQMPEDLESLSPEQVKHAFHELRVHQIELEMQNDELRQAQLELDASRARYFDLYDLAPVGYVTISEIGLILEANLTASSLLGVSCAALIKQPISRFIFKEDQDIYYLHRKQLLATGEPQVWELRMLKNGMQFWAHLAATTERNEAGASLFRITVSDISERKRGETARRESEEKFRKIIEQSSEGILLIDEQGIIIEWNRAYEVFSGLRQADALGHPAWDIQYKQLPAIRRTQVTVDHLKQSLTKMLETGQSHQFNRPIEIMIETPSGEPKVIEQNAFSIKTDKGYRLGIIIHDITQRKYTEERISLLANELQLTLDTVTVGICHLKDRRLIQANLAFDHILGYEIGETRGLETSVFYPDRASFEPLGQEAYPQLASGKTYRTEREICRKDGTRLWCSLTGRAVDAEKPYDGSIWVLEDISERKQAEENLRRNESLLRLVADNLPAYVAYVSAPDLRYQFVNHKYEISFQRSREQIIGQPASAILSQANYEFAWPYIERALNGKACSYENSFFFEKEQRWLQVHFVPNTDANGSVIGIVILNYDLTERKRVEDELRSAKDALDISHHELEQSFAREQQLAHTDELTGINNRRHLIDCAGHEFEIAARYQQPLSLIMFDIDHFKAINDTFGHEIGDQVLQRVTQAACAELRSVDVIGRYGGEEFIIVLPMTNAQHAYALAERIRVGVAAVRVPTEKADAAVTISIGIVEMIHATQTECAENMFRCADRAMYSAKQAGRNRTVIYDQDKTGTG